MPQPRHRAATVPGPATSGTARPDRRYRSVTRPWTCPCRPDPRRLRAGPGRAFEGGSARTSRLVSRSCGGGTQGCGLRGRRARPRGLQSVLRRDEPIGRALRPRIQLREAIPGTLDEELRLRGQGLRLRFLLRELVAAGLGAPDDVLVHARDLCPELQLTDRGEVVLGCLADHHLHRAGERPHVHVAGHHVDA
jgi:hypothetical protein